MRNDPGEMWYCYECHEGHPAGTPCPRLSKIEVINPSDVGCGALARQYEGAVRSLSRALSELTEARARIAEMEKILRVIADDGCGCWSPPDKTCATKYSDKDDWCWSCIAAAALGEGGEDE